MADLPLMAVDPQAIRDFANFPGEVPDTLLTQHIAIATRELKAATSADEAPAGLEDVWTEAVQVKALSSALPWLNTFALDGAAKVGRLEGSVDARFLNAEEVDKRIERLDARFDALVSQIINAGAEDETQGVSAGSISMQAV